MLALVDCNNFYASCERIFAPHLNNKPVIVLSNNDGCVVARSTEAKALGIFMAQPYFEIKELCTKHKVSVFSANFPLYGDISGRIVATLKNFTNNLEVYSIDESFLDAQIWPADLSAFAKQIRTTVLQNVGVPVSIGLASTKTRAKIANLIAKKHSKSGVFDLEAQPASMQERIFKTLDVEDVWGIGRASTATLSQRKIRSVWDFVSASDEFIKKHLSIRGVQTKHELLGHCMWPVGQDDADGQSISSTRTFAAEVRDLETLQKAITSFCQIACQKLRADAQICTKVSVSIATNRFKDPVTRYSGTQSRTLEIASNATSSITSEAISALKTVYKPGLSYKRAGVYLYDLKPQANLQPSLIYDNERNAKLQRVSAAADQIARRWGSQATTLASGFMRGHARVTDVRQRTSPYYTTSWGAIKKVK